MRLAPVVLAFASNPREAIEKAALSSRTTHAAREAVDACRYFAALLLGALQGRPKSEILSPHFSPVPDLWAGSSLAPKKGRSGKLGERRVTAQTPLPPAAVGP
jgi:ADP-ribosylglycohydrolase